METFKLLRYLACSSTKTEEENVREWLAGDTDGSRKTQYREAHLIFNGMTLYDNTRLNAGEPSRKGSGWKMIVTGCLASAAVIAFVVIGTARLSRISALDTLSETMHTVSVPSGKSMALTLEDGTEIWLNADSRLEYPVIFARDSRKVNLIAGEALFDVAKDSDRPFTVSTYASDIVVTGTRFNVIADEEDNMFSTALLDGEIRIKSKINEREEYILKPNDIVTMLDGHLYIEELTDPSTADCWTKGLVNISGVPFDELMKRFESAFGINIVIEKEELPVIRYSRGKIRVADGIDHAMSMLQLVSDFTYVKDEKNNTIIIN